MDISSDRAYWLLESYRTHATRLHFAGRIAGEEAACEAVIIAFDRDLHIVVVELFGVNRSWCRPIPLSDATFFLSMMGEPDCSEWAGYPFHLVLVLRYPDATTLIFAERSRRPEPANVTIRDLAE
jgi:hypothetical protein